MNVSDERKKFWSDKARWPNDALGYVFLGNAFEAVGKHLHPEFWDGTESNSENVDTSYWQQIGELRLRISPEKASFNQKLAIHRLLAQRRPDFGRVGAIVYGPMGPKIPAFSREEWLAGLDEMDRLNEVRQQKTDRRDEARRFIKGAILSGDLRFVLRNIGGGAFSSPQEPIWWNVDDLDRLFTFCQLNPKHPFSPGFAGTDFEYIFVDGSDLDKLLDPQQSERISPTTLTSTEELPDFRGERERLIDAVQTGRMFRLQAEELATEKGLAPLAPPPNPEQFRVLDLPDWTFEMTLAWIIWRSSERLLHFYQPYYDALHQLRSPWEERHPLNWAGVRAAYLTDIEIAKTLDEPEATTRLSFEEGIEELIGALETGRISAEATYLPSMKPQLIPANEWKRLIGIVTDNGRTAFANSADGTKPVYGEVLIERAQVLAVWPSEEAVDQSAVSSAVQPHRKSPSVAAVSNLLFKMMQCARELGIVAPSKTEAIDLVRAILPGSTRARIQEAMNKEELRRLLPDKPGPRGGRNPNRESELEKIRQNLTTADLRN